MRNDIGWMSLSCTLGFLRSCTVLWVLHEKTEISQTFTFSFLEDNGTTGSGSRPKTAASLQLLLGGITREVASLQENYEQWTQNDAALNQQDVEQVGAIIADLERKLNDVLQELAITRQMWKVSKESQSFLPVTVKSSPGNFRRDSPSGCKKDSSTDDRIVTKSRPKVICSDGMKSSLVKRGQNSRQTKGMTAEQLRNYYRERLFLNTVAKRQSLHADADKRVLNKLTALDVDPRKELQQSMHHRPRKSLPAWGNRPVRKSKVTRSPSPEKLSKKKSHKRKDPFLPDIALWAQRPCRHTKSFFSI